MVTGQVGIFALGDAAHGFFEFTLRPGADRRTLVEAVADLRPPHTTVGGVNLVVGFRPELWREVDPADTPADIHGFNEPLRGGETAQERVIGRTKPDSIEFKGAAMPTDSHVSRTKVVVNGEERHIFRRNVPYGNVSDHGTLFIGFSADQGRMRRMLEQMAGSDGGPRDALTRFTTPLTGAYYFVPSLQALARFTTPAAG